MTTKHKETVRGKKHKQSYIEAIEDRFYKFGNRYYFDWSGRPDVLWNWIKKEIKN